MYTIQERKKAIRLYIKYGLKAAPTIRELRYPSRKMLKRWYDDYKKIIKCLLIPRENLDIQKIREKHQQTSMNTVQRDEQLQRITELQDFIKDQPSDLTVFDEALIKRWLKQITICDDHHTVELKSELKVDVER